MGLIKNSISTSPDSIGKLFTSNRHLFVYLTDHYRLIPYSSVKSLPVTTGYDILESVKNDLSKGTGMKVHVCKRGTPFLCLENDFTWGERPASLAKGWRVLVEDKIGWVIIADWTEIDLFKP